MSKLDKIVPGSTEAVRRWQPVVEDISDPYLQKVTAVLLDNQAKSIIAQQRTDEAMEGATTVGKLGTFQKFAFPLVRRVFPELFWNKIGSTQPMEGPTSQIFYLGSGRQYGATRQSLYSKHQLTYRNMVASGVGGAGIDGDSFQAGIQLSAILKSTSGSPSTTYGGQIAAWPDATRTHGWNVSAGEYLSGSGIPEVNISIEQQPVVARTRKMRALWTIEASQDLKAYHNLDLEREVTELMGNELKLEIDRELVEDLRMIAYDTNVGTGFGGWYRNTLDAANSNNFGSTGGADSFTPTNWLYEFGSTLPTSTSGTLKNVFLIDLTSTALGFAPQHVGHVYANLLAVINFAANDIFTSTQRGAGSWLLTSPLMASLMESAAKLEGGVKESDGPSNMSGNTIQYKGKWAGKFDLYIDPLYPEDEILVGYKGSNPMDAGFVYCPYIPIESLPTITDPETFQPRKGILTRYGKAAVSPESRFYRIVRVVGPAANYMIPPFFKNTTNAVT